MDRSFYRFALAFRGGDKFDLKSSFAESMFRDTSFPREEREFDTISRYIEEKADSEMPTLIFDELYKLYEDRFL
jgi:uncharacterized protein YozE (UPF0346 family)